MSLSKFNPDSFEQLVRITSLKVIGPGVSVFGNGPDGGREATFQGAVPFPFPPTTQWDGYGVIQAKFKEKKETTKAEQDWAEKELRKELNSWKTSSKRNPKPEYYIFCTNVELTSAKNGGKDRLDKLIKSYKHEIGIKDHAIWDKNQIESFIKTHAEIRKVFLDYFTTGDLLAEWAQRIGGDSKHTERILTSFLTKSFLMDENSKLSQAGDKSEDKVSLSEVFIDPPVSWKCPDRLEPDPFDEPLKSLRFLSRVAACKLDPASLEKQEPIKKEGHGTSDATNQTESHLYNRFLFLGGPGSGKSTIGQFLSQLHRAAILARRPSSRIPSKVSHIISSLKKRCEEDEIPWPECPRYPFRIDLNAFAESLSLPTLEGAASLSHYIRKRINSEEEIPHQTFNEWLASYPTILILDGLDEVPWSSNREDVIGAIQEFLCETVDLEADMLVIASSRIDGYSGEFDGDHVAQLFLSPLDEELALLCAKRYLKSKDKTKDDVKFKEDLEILRNATQNPLIRELMTSPLQVTFMVTVVSASGRPSESRWQLFSDYYRTIYERELQKSVKPFNEVLNSRRPDIDTIHHRVGFILQKRGEGAGGTVAELTYDEFDEIVEGCLIENGIEGEELGRQRELITDAASKRLVFLTSKREGHLSFQVRPLQEFMAAHALTSGDTSEVSDGLQKITSSAYWRNTLLFACGRFFSEAHLRGHRSTIVTLCEELNGRSPDHSAASSGARAALNILTSRTTGHSPLFSRLFLKCALGLIDLPLTKSGGIYDSLVSIYEEAFADDYNSAISLRVGQKTPHLTLPSWLLLLHLEMQGIAWAADLAVKEWPSDVQHQYAIILAWAEVSHGHLYFPLNSPIWARITNIIPCLTLEQTESLFSKRWEFRAKNLPDHYALIKSIVTLFRRGEENSYRLLVEGAQSGIEVSIIPTSSDTYKKACRVIYENFAPAECHDEWRTLLSAFEFHIDPSADSLKRAAYKIAEHWHTSAVQAISLLSPWPLAQLMSGTQNPEELKHRIAEIEDWQDTTQWKLQESSWREDGIEISELDEESVPELTLLCAVHSCNFYEDRRSSVASLADYLFRMIDLPRKTRAANTFKWIFLFYCKCSGELHKYNPNQIQSLVLDNSAFWSPIDFLPFNINESIDKEGWLDVFNHLGESGQLRLASHAVDVSEAGTEWVLQEFLKNPLKTGLLRFAAGVSLHGYCFRTENVEGARMYVTSPTEIHGFAYGLLLLSCPEANKDGGDFAFELIAQGLNVDNPEARLSGLALSLEKNLRHSPLQLHLLKLLGLFPEHRFKERGDIISQLNDILEALPASL